MGDCTALTSCKERIPMHTIPLPSFFGSMYVQATFRDRCQCVGTLDGFLGGSEDLPRGTCRLQVLHDRGAACPMEGQGQGLLDTLLSMLHRSSDKPPTLSGMQSTCVFKLYGSSSCEWHKVNPSPSLMRTSSGGSRGQTKPFTDVEPCR